MFGLGLEFTIVPGPSLDLATAPPVDQEMSIEPLRKPTPVLWKDSLNLQWSGNDAPMAWNGEKFTAIEGPGVVWVARRGSSGMSRSSGEFKRSCRFSQLLVNMCMCI